MPSPDPPPYTITPAILSLVAEVAGEVGRLEAHVGTTTPPQLRRRNRIRTVRASLEIENNTLNLDPQTDQVGDQVTDQVAALLKTLGRESLSAMDCMNRLKLSHRPTFRHNYLRPAIDAGLVEPTIPDKPNSRLQKYRLTPAGAARLAG